MINIVEVTGSNGTASYFAKIPVVVCSKFMAIRGINLYPSQRSALPVFPSSSKLTIKCSQPFCQCLLVRCTKPEVLVLCNQLHTMVLTPGDGIDFDRVDDVGKRDDQLSCVFLFILIESYVFGSQDCP